MKKRLVYAVAVTMTLQLAYAVAVAAVEIICLTLDDSSVRVLPSSVYTRPALATNDTMWAMDMAMKGIGLWHERAQNAFNLSWINVAPPLSSKTNILTQLDAVLTCLPTTSGISECRTQSAGTRLAIVSLLPRLTAAEQISQACESLFDCVVLYPFRNDPSLFRTNTGARRFASTFTTVFDADATLSNFLELARFYQSKTAAILWGNTTEQSPYAVGWGHTIEQDPYTVERGRPAPTVLLDHLDRLGIQVIWQNDSITPGLWASEPDIFLAWDPPDDLALAMEQNGWTPKAVASNVPIDSPWFFTSTSWDARVRGDMYCATSDDTDDSPSVFADAFQERFGVAASVESASAAAALTMIERAVERGGPLRQALDTLDPTHPSFFGPLYTDDYGQLVADGQVLLQLQPDKRLPYAVGVGVGSATGLRSALGWPMPTWYERVEHIGHLGDNGTELGVFVLGGLISVYLLVLIALQLVAWNHPVLRAASSAFCLLFLLGTLLLNQLPWAWSLHPTPTACVMRIWVLQIGLTTSLSALIVKTWRLWRIFHRQTLQVQRLTDRLLMKLYLVVLTGVVVYTAIWTGDDAARVVTIVTDPIRPSENVYECATTDLLNRGAWGAVAFQLVLLTTLSVLAIVTHSLPDEFNESRWIAMTIYTYSLVLFAALMIVFLVTDRTWQFAARSGAIYLLVTNSATLLMVPKFVRVYCMCDVIRPAQHPAIASLPGVEQVGVFHSDSGPDSGRTMNTGRAGTTATTSPPDPRGGLVAVPLPSGTLPAAPIQMPPIPRTYLLAPAPRSAIVTI